MSTTGRSAEPVCIQGFLEILFLPLVVLRLSHSLLFSAAFFSLQFLLSVFQSVLYRMYS